MATRRPGTVAAINRQIDAINAKGRRANPSLSEEDAAFVREARARIKELDSLILQAIDARNWTTADRLDVQRGKLWKQVDKLEGRKPRSNNPARTATLVARKAAKNPGRVTVRKASPAFGRLPWWVRTSKGFDVASFTSKASAVAFGQEYADKHDDSVEIYRRDFKSWEK